MMPTLLPITEAQTVLTDETDFTTITNDAFLTAIFGTTFDVERPLVCRIAGAPENKGWSPQPWPCDTSDAALNWYTAPAMFVPNDQGRYRAQKRLGRGVHAVMLDDIGTKVPAARLAACPPTWLIETSPGNFQAGYIFAAPVDDHKQAEALKDALIEAGLCDNGATGATARWMRLPVAINGKAKYGEPPPPCRLTQWNPALRYTIDQIIEGLELTPSQPAR
ncbi:MAG: DNA-primase RepB domain-containing protein [Burkholderiales bacterium]